MKLLRSILVILLLTPVSLLAQGVRMSADFLPLAVGNKWVYELSNQKGDKVGEVEVAVQEYKIVSGRSFYVFTRFPFAAASEGEPSCCHPYPSNKKSHPWPEKAPNGNTAVAINVA